MSGTVKAENRIAVIPIFRIRPRSKIGNRGYSRRELSPLSKSIEKNGILQPLIVRDISGGEYELITGERRLRAAVMAGLTKVPCIIFHCSEKQSAVYSIIENIHRDDADIFKRAETIDFLINQIGYSAERAARQLGVTERTVMDYLNILNFTETEKKLISEHRLSIYHAVELIKICDASVRRKAIAQVIDESLSAAETSQLVFDITNGAQSQRRTPKVIIKDMRLFYNTIRNAVMTMQRAGLNALMEHSENDNYIEYKIRIAKVK